MGRPLRRVPAVGHRRRCDDALVAARVAPPPRVAPIAPRGRSPRSGPSRSRTGRAASPSSTACSAAASCPAPRSCSSGEPGVGKSTLLLEVASRAAASGAARALRQRRGVGQPGAAARRAHRRHAPQPLPRRRDRPRRRSSGRSTRSKPQLVIVDSVQTVSSSAHRRHGGRPVAGARGGVDPDPRRRKTATCRCCSSATSRKTASIAGPRLLEHLVDVVLPVRGRPADGAALRPRPQEPLRPHRRGRLLRDDRRRHRRGRRPERAVPVARRRTRSAAPASRSRSRVAARCPSRCRRSSSPARRRSRAASSTASTPRAWPCCSPCSNGAPASALGDADVYVSTVGGIRLTEPGADLAIALALASASRDKALPAHHGGRRRDQPRGRDPAGVVARKQRASEARGWGSRRSSTPSPGNLREALRRAFSAASDPRDRELDAAF